MITLNAYLSKFGITELSLISAQYVISGAAALAWLGAMFFFPFIFLIFWHMDRRRSSTSILFSVLAIPYQVAIAWLLIGHTEGKAKLADALTDLCGPHILILFNLVVIYCILFPPTAKFPKLSRGRKAASLVCFGTMILFFLVWYLHAFGEHVLPTMKPMFGGMQPRHVQLLTKSEEVDGLKLLGIPFQTGAQNGAKAALTAKLDLLMENDHFYLLHVPDGPTVQLDKSEKWAIVTLPK